MNLYAVLFDIIVAIIIIVCAAWYAHKGFVAGLFSFFGTLIAVVAAALVAQYATPTVFDTFFRPGLEENVTAAIAQTGITDLGTLLRSVLSFLPDSLIETIAASLGEGLNFAAPDIANTVVEQVMRPIISPLVMALLFFALFVILRIVVKLLSTLALGVRYIPVVSTLNSAMGAVIGVFIAALYIFLMLCVLWALDALNPNNTVTSSLFADSITWRLLYGLNFFS